MMVNAIGEWLPFQLKIIRQNAFGILIIIDEQKESSTGSFSLKMQHDGRFSRKYQISQNMS